MESLHKVKQLATKVLDLLSAIAKVLLSGLANFVCKPVLSNLGFLLQISGMFTLPAIAYAFYLNELNAAISFFIAAVVLVFMGFILNAFWEIKK
jgi:hypothetical protein